MSTGLVEPASPLDVLSFAASMVEKSGHDQRDSHSPSSSASSLTSEQHLRQSKGCERSPSFKERHPKFRKTSTPEYMVAAQSHRQSSSTHSMEQAASSPHEDQDMEIDVVSRLTPPPAPTLHHPHPVSNLIYSFHHLQQQQQPQQPEVEEGPLDMSIKKKPRSNTPPPPYRFTPLFAPPPPYFPQSQVSPTERLPPPPSYEASTQFALRASALAALAPPIPVPPRRPTPEATPKEDPRPIREITIITADSSADPLLDEHFRRSLGANYQSLFRKSPTPSQGVTSSVSQGARSAVSSTVTSSVKSRSPSLSPDSSSTVDPVKAFKDDMGMEGYTVEDHFAKALGDTWVKLQAQAEKEKALKDKSSTRQVFAT